MGRLGRDQGNRFVGGFRDGCEGAKDSGLSKVCFSINN